MGPDAVAAAGGIAWFEAAVAPYSNQPAAHPRAMRKPTTTALGTYM
jgi:hypothetical protein